MERWKRGFTLIELLVVIAIIGVLAAIILVSLTSARAKGRDSNRVANIQTIRKAVELFYATNGYYPNVVSQNCTGDGWNQLRNALVPTYISVLPNDPGSLAYLYCSDLASNSQEYLLKAQTETTPQPTATGFHGTFYTVWGGDDPNCNAASDYCITVCAAGYEGPGNISAYPPNCGTY